MNERIRELVNKSISDVDYIRDDDFTNEELSKMYIPDCFAVKFAELIVRECIREIGYKSAELLDIDFYPHYQERLKKYFGVEE